MLLALLICPPRVALRKESVDRNRGLGWRLTACPMSLSARRAWIEILLLRVHLFFAVVALRKESVDRNSKIFEKVLISMYVALRKESVDRNFDTMQVIIVIM